MDMHSRRLLVLGTLVALTSPAWAQLVSETVEGTQRICNYRNDASATRALETFKVGLGEPCPAVRPLPDPEPQPIPPMAQFSRQLVRGDRRICFYGWAGQEYQHSIPAIRRCPLTPYFN